MADGILVSFLKETPRKGRQAAGRAAKEAILIFSKAFHTYRSPTRPETTTSRSQSPPIWRQ